MGIVLGALHYFNVADLLRADAPAERFTHLVLDFHRQDASRLADFGRNTESEIAGPSSQVRNHLAATKAKGTDYLRRAFFLFTLSTVQPRDAARPHDLSDFPAHVKLAGTVRIINCAVFLKGWGRRRRGLRLCDRATGGTSDCRPSR